MNFSVYAVYYLSESHVLELVWLTCNLTFQYNAFSGRLIEEFISDSFLIWYTFYFRKKICVLKVRASPDAKVNCRSGDIVCITFGRKILHWLRYDGCVTCGKLKWLLDKWPCQSVCLKELYNTKCQRLCGWGLKKYIYMGN